jgi:hypothetical protein
MPRQTDLAVRRLHLSLVGGPWCGDETVVEKSAELLLDMCRGHESRPPNAGARRPARACVQAHEDLPEQGKERVSCRAS